MPLPVELENMKCQSNAHSAELHQPALMILLEKHLDIPLIFA